MTVADIMEERVKSGEYKNDIEAEKSVLWEAFTSFIQRGIERGRDDIKNGRFTKLDKAWRQEIIDYIFK